MFRVCRVWLGRWDLRVNLGQKGRMADQGSRGPRELKVSSSIIVTCHDIHVSGDRGLLSSVSGDLPTAILEGPPGPPGEKGDKIIVISSSIYKEPDLRRLRGDRAAWPVGAAG